MKVTNVMKSSNLKWLGLFLLLFGIIVFQNSCSSSKGGNGVSVAYSPNKTSATVNGYTDSNGKLTWHDSEYNRDFDVEAVNQQGTPLPNIHVQIFSGSNAAFAIFIDPTFTYQPYITTVTDQLGSSVSTTSLSGLSLLPEDLTTIATPVKVVGTLFNIGKTAISQGFDISPQYNLRPQDVQLLMNELPSFSPKQFYDTNTDASNALGVDLVNRSVTTAIVFVGGCAAGAVIGGGWNLGVGAAPGCLAGASIVSALTGIFGGQQAGPMDIVTIGSGIASLFANEPVDQRYTIADLQANDLAGDLASYVIHVPGGKSKVILPIEPDSLSITPMALTFITIPSTQNVSVMASYTYFNQKRGPADYNSGRFSYILNPNNIANIGYGSYLYQITKIISGAGTIAFDFNDGVVDRTNTVSLSDGVPVTTLNWAQLAPLPTSSGWPSVAVWNGKIYVGGGCSSPLNQQFANASSAFEVYDPSSNAWTVLAPLPMPVVGAPAAAVNGHIYVFGGWNPSTWTANSTVQIYDIATNTWSTGPSMPTGRSWAAVAVVNNQIYVLGGVDGGYDTTVEMFDPSTSSWTTKAPFINGRYMPEAVAYNGEIYLIGGDSWATGSDVVFNDLQIYNPQTNIWTAGTSMPTPASGLVGTGINNKIYALGGNKLALIYDISSNNWSYISSNHSSDGSAGFAVVNGVAYLIGGGGWGPTVNTVESAVIQ